MKPTRRGFLGALGAIVAAPTVVIADIGRGKPTSTKDKSPVVAEREDDKVTFNFCTMTLFDCYGEKMVCKNVPYTIEFLKKNSFHIKADLGTMGVDFGEGLGSFGPISKIITTLHTDLGMIDLHSELTHDRHIVAGSDVNVEFDASIDPT